MKEKIIDKINEYSGVLGIVITITTLMASFIFKLCSYFYEIGRNFYFKIDNKFLNINFEANLMSVLAYGFISILILIFSYFIYKWSLTEDCKKCRKSKVVIASLIISLIIAFFKHGFEWINLVSAFIVYSVYSYIIIKNFGFGMYKILEEKDVENKNSSKGLIGIIIVLPFICWVLGYVDGFSHNKFDYFTIDEQQYVVVDVYNDFYYTYPCDIEGNNLVIYSNSRRIFEISDVITKSGRFDVNIK